MEEYVLSLIRNNLTKYEIVFTQYFGEKYRNYIRSSIDNTEFIISRGNGLCDVDGTSVYLMDEPVCVKKEKQCYIVLPLNFFKDKTCNVSFAHLLLHSLINEYEIEGNDVFNDTLIDYIANDMGNLLKKNEVNLSPSKDVLYESNSLYKRFYSFVEDYYLTNREEINHNLIVNEHNYLNEEAKKIADELQNAFDDYCFNLMAQEENKIIKK